MKLATTVFLVLLLVAAAAGQQQPEARRTFASAGTFEIGGSGYFSSYVPVRNGGTGSAAYSVGVSPMVGYFALDELEIVLDPLTLSYAWSEDMKAFDMMPMGGLAYNFKAHPRAFPYVEGLAGLAYSWSDNGLLPAVKRSGLAWAARVGVKALMTTTAIVNIGVQYQQVTLKLSSDTERNGYNQIALAVGLSVWL